MILNTNDFAQNMIRQLPEFYFVEDLKYDNVLRKYLMSAFVGGADDLLKSINGVRDFSDPLKCPSEDLPALCESWGIQYEPSISETYQRKQLAYIGELYRRKGTYSCVKYLVRTVTGCDCDLLYSKDSETGERKFNVILIAKSLQDINTGKIEEDTYAVQKILPKFLPFYLLPEVSYSSPRNPIPTPIRYTGERLSQYVRNDLTPQSSPINLLSNPDFSLGTSGWICDSTDTVNLKVSEVIGPSNLALSYIPITDSSPHGFYQDINVAYKDKLNLSFKFNCPKGGATVKLLYTFLRKDNTVIHSILCNQVDLSIKGLWKTLKRTLVINDIACVRVRVTICSDTPNLEVQMTLPVASVGCDSSISIENPTIVSKSVGNSKVDIKWGSVDRVSTYRVFYRISGEDYWVSEDISGISCTIDELTNGVTYEFAICSRTSNGFNTISDTDIFTLTPTGS